MLCPEFVYFPINAFSSYIYIGNRHFFLFRLSLREYSYIYKDTSSFFILCPDSLYIQLFIYRWFLIYIQNNPFLFFVLPRLIAISLYIVNFCIFPRLIYSRDTIFLFIYFAQNLWVFLFRFLQKVFFYIQHKHYFFFLVFAQRYLLIQTI